MESNTGDIKNTINGLKGRIAAEKKKIVMAACLVSVMVFMWIRILSGKGPNASEASLIAQTQAAVAPVSQPLKITYVELPKIKGRNDKLTRDFFTVNKESLYGSDTRGFAADNNSQAYSGQVSDKLKLEAVVLGPKSQAFINDRLYYVGDKFSVKNGIDIYDCEVIKIGVDEVHIRCGKMEIALKLAQTVEIAN